MPKQPSFGELLRHYRAGRGLTQAKLASAMSVTGNYVALLETGRRRHPARQLVDAAAVALALTPAEHNQLLLAAGYGLAHETGPIKRAQHPAHRALQQYLELPANSPQFPVALKKVLDLLLGAASEQRRDRQDKTILRAAELLGMGYYHRTSGARERPARSVYAQRRRRLEEGLYSLSVILADTTIPLEKRIKLVEELASLAAWRVGRPLKPETQGGPEQSQRAPRKKAR